MAAPCRRLCATNDATNVTERQGYIQGVGGCFGAEGHSIDFNFSCSLSFRWKRCICGISDDVYEISCPMSISLQRKSYFLIEGAKKIQKAHGEFE